MLLEDERARISMRLRMLVLSVAQEARRGNVRQGKARRGASGMWRGQAQAMAKGKPGRLCWAIVIVVLEVGDPKTVPHSNAGQSKLW